MNKKDDDELFTCCICGKVIQDKDVPFDVVCCELPEELKVLFPKYDEGRLTNILLGSEVVRVGVPAKDSEVAMSGADITFMTCSEECKKAIEDMLENSGLNMERIDKGEG